MNKLKNICTLLFTTIILLTTSIATGADSANNTQTTDEKAQILSKEEVVYALLSLDGLVDGVYVINTLNIDSPGVIKDYGDYTVVKNLTDSNTLTISDGSITGTSDTKRFYYQGNMLENQLPWIIKAKYFLDGEEILAEQLAGEEGSLKISIETQKNEAINSIFYENYLLQISLTLDTQKVTDILAQEGTIANAGANKIITFTQMPNTNGSFLVTANVEDFEMGGIEISAIPFSMNFDLPDTSSLEDQFKLFSEAVGNLSAGANSLNAGMSQLSGGANKLKTGSTEFKDGLDAVTLQSDTIIQSSEHIKNSLEAISTQIPAELKQQISPYLTEIAVYYEQFHDGLVVYTGAVNQVKEGYGNIHSNIVNIAQGLSSTSTGMSSLADGTKQLNDKTNNMPTLIEDTISEMLSSTTGFVPVSFVSEQNTNIRSVQFVFRTQDIQKQKPMIEHVQKEKETFWTRLKNLFS